MADLSLEWDDDFVPDATGDLLVIDGDDRNVSPGSASRGRIETPAS